MAVGFDIGTLLAFRPAAYRCHNCLALWPEPLKASHAADYRSAWFECPICSQTSVAFQSFDALRRHLRIEGSDQQQGVIEQSQRLARIAAQFNRRAKWYPPINALYDALATARSFIHIATFGITYHMIGALRTTAYRVPVRGFVAGVTREDTRDELLIHAAESADCDLRVIGDGGPWVPGPHQKLVIVDGLLAFKGSANLTVNGWRNAAQNLDEIEVVTDVGAIIDLNNRLFASVWPSTSPAPAIEEDTWHRAW